jgi:Bacterial regulatory helix-turn-helix protein, lysR family
MDSLPPLTAIRAFDAAARLGSFAKAAAELHVTHWAVGKQIRVLEDWMGVPMFRRLPRGIVLTDEGTELAREVGSASRLFHLRYGNCETQRRSTGSLEPCESAFPPALLFAGSYLDYRSSNNNFPI